MSRKAVARAKARQGLAHIAPVMPEPPKLRLPGDGNHYVVAVGRLIWESYDYAVVVKYRHSGRTAKRTVLPTRDNTVAFKWAEKFALINGWSIMDGETEVTHAQLVIEAEEDHRLSRGVGLGRQFPIDGLLDDNQETMFLGEVTK